MDRTAMARGFFDVLKSGIGDRTPESALSRRQLALGQKAESEHTNDPRIAREIARDHLTEFPNYYDRLKSFEKRLKKTGFDYDSTFGDHHEDSPEGVERQHSYEYNNVAQRNLETDVRGRYLDSGAVARRRRISAKKPSENQDVPLDTADSNNPTGDSFSDMDSGSAKHEPM